MFYTLCLEEFTPVEMLPPGTFQRDGSGRALVNLPLRLQEIKQ